jgi:osmotically-inducible protein OsmY
MPVSRLALLAALLGAGMAATGCTPEGTAVGLGISAVDSARQERGFAAALADTRMRYDINRYLLGENTGLFVGVHAAVHEGRVLLTGAVANDALRRRAVEIAGEAPGVREIVDEIVVMPTYDALKKARDEQIVAELRTRIVLDSTITSSNFALDAVDGTVYLFGIGRSHAEVGRVERHAAEIGFVRRIISHVIVRDDPRRRPRA